MMLMETHFLTREVGLLDKHPAQTELARLGKTLAYLATQVLAGTVVSPLEVGGFAFFGSTIYFSMHACGVQVAFMQNWCNSPIHSMS